MLALWMASLRGLTSSSFLSNLAADYVLGEDELSL